VWKTKVSSVFNFYIAEQLNHPQFFILIIWLSEAFVGKLQVQSKNRPVSRPRELKFASEVQA